MKPQISFSSSAILLVTKEPSPNAESWVNEIEQAQDGKKQTDLGVVVKRAEVCFQHFGADCQGHGVGGGHASEK